MAHAPEQPPVLLLGADENESLPILANLHRHGHWSSRIDMAIAQSDHAKLRSLLEEIAGLLSPGLGHQTPTV